MENEKIQHLINEHQTENGDRITDSCLSIRDKLYHIECQSTPDNTMVVRMVEYDFAIALSKLEQMATAEEKSIMYSNLIDQIIKISDYMLRKEKHLQERMSEVMGGQVLELLSERAERLGTWKISIKLYEKGIISEQDAADNLDMEVEEFLMHVEEYHNGTLK